jgi:hypothetical protein
MVKDPKGRDGRKQDEDLGGNKAAADPDNNLSRGAPFDRDEKTEQQRKERPEHRGRLEGEAHKQWERKPDDLGRMPPSSAKALPAEARYASAGRCRCCAGERLTRPIGLAWAK